MYQSAATIPLASRIHVTGRALDRGRQRTANHDSVEIFDLIRPAPAPAALPVTILAVADGVGNQPGAKMASKMAVRTVINHIIEASAASRDSGAAYNSAADYEHWLRQAVGRANDLIYDCNQRNSVRLTTTLVVALVAGNSVHIANIGDSRAYIASTRSLRQLTTDHSVTQKLLEAGLINAEEARHHPQRNTLTQAVGAHTLVFEQLCRTTLDDDEYLLLCSDGLYKELNESDIQSLIYRSGHPQQACDTLLNAANTAGGRDNIAVSLLRWDTQLY